MNQDPAAATTSPSRISAPHALWLKWAIVVLSGLLIVLAPRPAGITPEAWRLLAIFVATVVGSIVRPVSGGAIVLVGLTVIALTRSMPVNEALARTVADARALETLRLKSTLAGFSDPTVWLVLAAFFLARGMIKTGLGRRIALLFVRAIGQRSIGLGYALVGTDLLLATVVPSNGARCGGIIFPVTKGVAEAYDSTPGPTASRLGAFLMSFVYQCEVIICAMFLTGQAGNLIIQKFARQSGGIELSYSQWMLGSIVPGLLSLVVTGLCLYWLFPPEIRETPGATEFARRELREMGRPSSGEKLMLAVFALAALLWATTKLHLMDYAVVALLGVVVLLVVGVITWEDLLAERNAWDVFIWYGGLVRMAEALGETGIMDRFAVEAAKYTTGWHWWWALAVLALLYFYAHYAFASITAHVLAMYIPFLTVTLAAGAPPYLAVLLLAHFSNLSASLTHYGTTPGPIFFGAGYVSQQRWWQIGLLASISNLLIWSVTGPLWWKLLGWW